MSRESSPFGEVRIQITTPPDDVASEPAPTTVSSPKLSFSVPLTATIIPMEDSMEKEEEGGGREENKEKKKQRKSMDDNGAQTKTKRKDTATSLSFSNFFHRFTRSEKEEKHKSTVSIAEEEKFIERPDKLVLPQAGDENWTELKTLGTDNFRTALDMGNETGLLMYEWKPDSLEETLLVEYSPARKDLIRMEIDSSQAADIEKSLSSMLEEFRSGSMRSFSDEQLLALRAAKQDHEDVTNMHLALYSLAEDEDERNEEIEARLESVCDKLAEKMISMHHRLSDLVPAHH